MSILELVNGIFKESSHKRLKVGWWQVCEMFQGLVILVIGLFSYAWSSSPASWVLVIMVLF